MNSELWAKSDNELKEYYNQYDIDDESMMIRKEHYEQRRMDKLQILLEERKNVIKEEEEGVWNRSNVIVNRSFMNRS